MEGFIELYVVVGIEPGSFVDQAKPVTTVLALWLLKVLENYKWTLNYSI